MRFRSLILAGVLTFSTLLTQCNKKANTLFQLKDADDTGIYFNNLVVESDSFNILTYEYIYNGGGVGIADFNNDGKQDIFFSGNQVPNKLYLNQGGFKFNDVTERANVNVPGRWNSGVVVVDINNDGWKDLYVCATTNPNPEDRRNMLFVNQGLNDAGEPVFKEMAGQYKIDHDGHSVMAAFFDYDLDGDLDLYVLQNQKLLNAPTNYRPKIADGSAANNDRLFRNEGNGTFTDVTLEAGILFEGFGLGLAISDLNKDGWPDIYVSNDYLSNDILYINNKNGTFKNLTADFIGHQSQFSMGNDAADINNDALPDIITLDMLPETNARKKTTIGNKSYLTYINNEKFGYEYQYVRNMLHINNGLDQQIKFSEIGQLAGIFQTEWSWSPLMADFDNDGNKDVLITNGFPKDITDKDFANYRADVGNIASTRLLLDSIPEVKIPNYAFKNNGDLTFTDVTKSWGMDTPSYSNGAAFADLDNDGDLDYVVNNINDIAFVYENNLLGSSQKDHNFLNVKLKGSNNNLQAIGTKLLLYYDSGRIQYHEQFLSRGFLSSVDEIIHFGLGNNTKVDSIAVEWPDGSRNHFKNVDANQALSIEYKAQQNHEQPKRFTVATTTLFERANTKLKINFIHQEDDKIDFNLQRTLPHKFSQTGPGICVGDINNDGLEDFVIGGSARHDFTVYKQRQDGTFESDFTTAKAPGKYQQDQGLLLFDVENDGDLDLYIVSGGIEEQRQFVYQDRLYLNNGKGNFTLNAEALPEVNSSGSCVRAADYDHDGDLDLFVGGRVVPGSYPLPPENYVLRNDRGKFTNVTKDVCAELAAVGMVTDALWTDFTGDGKPDLIVVGEFMPITFFTNENAKLVRIKSTGIEQRIGWWSSITAGDFDNDGDIDYIAGNLGLNNNFQVKENLPLKIYAKDFDGNGSVDPVLACYMRESMNADVKKLYPIHFWDELNSQSPKFRNKFARYKQYSKVTIDEVLSTEDLKDALILEANHMASSYIQNLGNNKFSLIALPMYTQIAPVNGMITNDLDEDGNLDVVMVGNDYGNEVFAGRYDAFTGMILLGNGKGDFTVVPSAKSGFYVPGNAKALVNLQGQGNDLFVATQNRDSAVVFVKTTPAAPILDVKPMESYAEMIFTDGRTQRVEFYYGSGFLSQGTRKMRVPKNVKGIVIYDYAGNSRKWRPNGI
ncbi:VCBS repeat-containing protein [Chryseolinea sp. H1M3-3]|uniref:VCBS repeat-containing protein n=1 Tax=Chryseolinea sp. H1M3-3 TaxID=3034144 RepID=UPI0023ED0999|nr:VCBS repeat-containing protein [Chryseolinea sp. H1M3-3]